MSDPTAGTIRLDRVSLTYPVYKRLVLDRLREVLGALFPSMRPASKCVLDDVSLSVLPGEIVGLVGANGAGKTTLLKVIAGLIASTVGAVQVQGKVMALLATGVGFRGNLTGRENAYYGGLLLGLRRTQVDELIDAIFEFSGLGAAFDQPYFTYSSGMRSRLGFALATSVPTDIIILDETLATGDHRFVSRCYKKIQELRCSGRTIIFVSHNLGEIARLTQRVLVLDQGRLVYDGATSAGLAFYEDQLVCNKENPIQSVIGSIVVEMAFESARNQRMNHLIIGADANMHLKIISENHLGPCFVFIKIIETESNRLVTYVTRNRYPSLLDETTGEDDNISISAGLTQLDWYFPEWVLGEGNYQCDVYVGPPTVEGGPMSLEGSFWRNVCTIHSTYANPRLRGANAVLELPATTAVVKGVGCDEG